VCRYSLFGSFFIGSLLDSTASVSHVGTGFSESVESLAGLHLGGDGSELGTGGSCGDGGVTVGLRAVLGGLGVNGVGNESLLGLGLSSGEEDQFLLVHVKSINVPCELFLAGVGSAVIDRDSNGTGESGGELGLLEFSKGEATTVSDLTGVLSSLAGDNGAEGLGRTGVVSGSASLSTLSSSEFLGGLVEVSVGSSLPVLAEMDVGNRVVVLDHCDLYIQ
jgi:hypothetical protein